MWNLRSKILLEILENVWQRITNPQSDVIKTVKQLKSNSIIYFPESLLVLNSHLEAENKKTGKTRLKTMKKGAKRNMGIKESKPLVNTRTIQAE